MYIRKFPKFFKNPCFIAFLFLLSANRAYAQDSDQNSYIVVHAHNPEGIEIASIEGVGQNSVEIYDGNNLIGFGAYGSKTHNKPIAISSGTHDIKVKFNGITKEQIISVDSGETKPVIFTFDRTNYIDEIKNKLPMNFTDTVSISGLTDSSARVWKETDLYAIGGDFQAQFCSADISITVQGIITPLEDNRFHMEHHILGGTSSVGNIHPPPNTGWSAGVTGFVVINQENVITLPSVCNIWFVQGWGIMPTLGGMYLHEKPDGYLHPGEQGSNGPICSYISDVTECRRYLFGLLPGSYTINGGFRQPAGVYSRTGYGDNDSGTENMTNYNSTEDIELASSVSNVPYYLGLYIEAKTDKDLYEANEEVKISCIVIDGTTGLPISADMITAEITKPDETKEIVLLSEVATGNYEGTFSNSSLLGAYGLKIQVEKEGYCGASAELDFIVGMLEILDGSDFSGGKEIWDTPEKLFSTEEVSVKGVVADGVTRLLLRLNVNEPTTVTFSLEGGTGYPKEDGVLRSVLRSDVFQEGSSITVNSVNTSSGEKVFAIYQAPEHFTDVPETKITLKIKSNRSPSFGFLREIKLVRPPVILLHGLWSNASMWDKFNLTTIYNEAVFAANYPNDVHFAENSGLVSAIIESIKKSFRDNGIAMVQTDVIGHSMGGLLARIYALGEKFYPDIHYYREDNFYKGDINKLITLDSPHKGSFLAEAGVPCAKTGHSKFTDFILKKMDKRGMSLTKGAAEDLMISSDAIQNMNKLKTSVPCHAIVGNYSEAYLTAYITPEGTKWVVEGLPYTEDLGLGIKLSPYAILNALLDEGYGYIIIPAMNIGTDLAVDVASQRGGLDSFASKTFEHHHMDVTSQDVAEYVIELLNANHPAADSPFETGFPAQE